VAEVEYRQIDKIYPDGTHAITGLNLKVEEGEMVVLVGPSGCGKSTALRLGAGLEPVTRGEILIGRQCMNDCPPQHRNIAMVFQNYALYPHMSVRRNLEFPLRMKKLPKSEVTRRVDKTARLLGLSEVLQRRPGQLSGGQCQRVAMGRAMVREPRVFLMDEPLSNLDAKLRTQIRAEIADLQRRSEITTIYVTHDQIEAMTLGHRIAVFDKGRLQQVGPPQEVYDHPKNTFVAAFLGSPGMNIVSARVNSESAMLESIDAGWKIPIEPLVARVPSLVNYLREHRIQIGLRPEGFLTRQDGGGEVVIESVESLGHESLVYFRPLDRVGDSGQAPLAARVSGLVAEKPGNRIRLELDIRKLHFFTAEGGIIG
jgi:multiple sugar transport system ATP-binding protein